MILFLNHRQSTFVAVQSHDLSVLVSDDGEASQLALLSDFGLLPDAPESVPVQLNAAVVIHEFRK